jgi:hypothetical protein
MKRHLLCRIVTLALALLLAPAVTARDDRAAVDSARRPPGLERPTEVAPPPRGLASPWLFHGGNRVELEPPDVQALVDEDLRVEGPGPLRTGVVLPLEIDPVVRGQWTKLDDDGWLWTMSFASRDAVALNLRFEPLRLPDGAELIVYGGASLERLAIDSFTGPTRKRGYVTRDVYASEVRVEYYVPPELDHGKADAAWRITGLVYGYRTPSGELSLAGVDAGELPCHLDATCYTGSYLDPIDGTAYIWYLDGSTKKNCSGAMLNRSPTDFTPLVMTAEHCGITASDVDWLHTIWNFNTDQCNGTPADPNLLPDTGAQAILVSDWANDFFLLGSEFEPGPLIWMGWNTAALPDGSAATGVHHPMGTHKRISFGTKTQNTTRSDGRNIYRVRYPQGSGLTEPGSSGSALFEGNSVRGVLSITYGTPTCSSYNDTGYGRFDLAWPRLQPYLQPTDPVYVDKSWSGTETGTIGQPFDTFLEGVYAVIEGSHMYVEAGNYSEPCFIDKGMIVHATNGSVVLGAP